MKSEYQAWIEQYALKRGSIANACVDASEKMAKQFPELTVVRGFVLFDEADRVDLPTPQMELEARKAVYHREVGVPQHCWCVGPGGEVVDPTKAQYKRPENIIYVAYSLEAHGPLPSGKCPDCGDLTFPEQGGFCDSTCRKRFDDYMKEERGDPYAHWNKHYFKGE